MIQAPRTRETPCRGLGRGRRGAGPRGAAQLPRGAGQLPRAPGRQGSDAHAASAPAAAALPLPGRRRAARTHWPPPCGADSATAAATPGLVFRPPTSPQRPGAARQTLTRAPARSAGGRGHRGGESAQGPSPRLQRPPGWVHGGRHGGEDGEPEGPGATARERAARRQPPRRPAPLAPPPRGNRKRVRLRSQGRSNTQGTPPQNKKSNENQKTFFFKS